MRAAFERVLKGETPVLDVQHRYLHRTGAIVWAQANVAMMHDAAGHPNYLIVHLRDISGERESEHALQALNQTLEHRVAESAAALEAMSHQQEPSPTASRTTCARRCARSTALPRCSTEGDAALDDAGRDHLGRIRAAAARMGELIDALLDLSRANRTEMKSEPVDLSLLAEWTGAELQDAEPGRAAEIDVAPGLVVAGDERQLKLMLTQLLDNAWKFSRDRDRVRIEVSGERDGDRLHVRIRDHGAGFDMRYADKLFEPFQRLHRADEGGGNGIGLAIVRRIVERHGGRRPGRIRARPGQHASISTCPRRCGPRGLPRIARPMANESAVHDAQGDPAGRGQPGRRRADPHCIHEAKIANQLSWRATAPKRWITCSRAARMPSAIRPPALDRAARPQPAQGRRPRSAAGDPRQPELTRSLPVVVMTTSAEPFDVEASYALGVNSYIQKPVDFERFVWAVQQVGLYWLVLNHPRDGEDGSLRREQLLGALEQDPAGGDVLVAALRPIAAMGVGECGRRDQQRSGARHDPSLLEQEFGFAGARTPR